MLASGVGNAAPVNLGSSDESASHDKVATSTGTMNSIIKKFGIPSWRTASSFNYLEPAATIYGKMAESETSFETYFKPV